MEHLVNLGNDEFVDTVFDMLFAHFFFFLALCIVAAAGRLSLSSQPWRCRRDVLYCACPSCLHFAGVCSKVLLADGPEWGEDLAQGRGFMLLEGIGKAFCGSRKLEGGRRVRRFAFIQLRCKLAGPETFFLKQTKRSFFYRCVQPSSLAQALFLLH